MDSLIVTCGGDCIVVFPSDILAINTINSLLIYTVYTYTVLIFVTLIRNKMLRCLSSLGKMACHRQVALLGIQHH